jgi:hypothetical protein
MTPVIWQEQVVLVVEAAPACFFKVIWTFQISAKLIIPCNSVKIRGELIERKSYEFKI